HRARPVLSLRDLALEVRVLERVVLDVDGEALLARLQRNPLRNGPARERSVALEAEVVVEAPRDVALDHEDRLLRALLRPERLGGRLRIALPAVLAELRHLRSFTCRTAFRARLPLLLLLLLLRALHGLAEGLHQVDHLALLFLLRLRQLL